MEKRSRKQMMQEGQGHTHTHKDMTRHFKNILWYFLVQVCFELYKICRLSRVKRNTGAHIKAIISHHNYTSPVTEVCVSLY